MSKELEALEKLGEKERITGVKNACYLVDKIKNDSEFETVKQALTPPTVDEVCKALSEYLKEEIRKPVFIKICGCALEIGVYTPTVLIGSFMREKK